MYKVVIVDDEKQLIDGLSKMIKWQELGFEVAGTARNGVEALPVIRALRPDLVVTDVRMPEMDGLQMLEHIRKQISQDMEFIILSGFSDFKYAQKALQYNVKSYILKPIDESELYGALIDIKTLLDEKELRKSLRIKAFINDFISGEQPERVEAALASEEQYGIRCIAVERHIDLEAIEAPGEMPGVDLSRSIAEKIGQANMRFVLRNDRSRCHIVAGASLMGSFGYDVTRLASSLHEHLRVQKCVRSDILVGKRVAGFRELHESVQSLADCRNMLFYRNTPSIVMYDAVKDEKFLKVYEDNGSAIKIISAFRKNDPEKLAAALDAMVEHFKTLQLVPEIARVQLDSVLASLVQILCERRDDTGGALERFATYKKHADKLNVTDLGQLAQRFCSFCCGYATEHGAHEDLADKAARYVDEHYARPTIKVNEIAERFYVNPAYLGQQFARKKGYSLNHYINMVRIERAKELLNGTSRRIYEIALETGFEDPNYFSSKFYEYTGVTPSDYRGRTDRK